MAMFFRGAGVLPSAVVFTTFDPANTASNASLDGTKLIFTINSDSIAITRSIANHSSGKFYFEAAPSFGGDGAWIGIGVANSAELLNPSNRVGEADANGTVVSSFGTRFYNSSTATLGITYSTGQTIAVAVDVTNSLIWFSVSAGVWTDNVGGTTGNPASGTGGLSTSVITGALFAIVQARYISGGDNQKWTANFGASAYSLTIPAGFGNW